MKFSAEKRKTFTMVRRYTGLRSAIRDALANCMALFTHKKAFEEPDYTVGIVLSIADALRPMQQRWGLKFGGCFIHQSPRISYLNGSSGLNSCELGDLLIICHDCNEDRYNAALLQLKMTAGKVARIIPEPNQLYVYMNWPEIIWKKEQKSYCIIPKTVSQGALYGVVHPLERNGDVVGARMNVASASQEIPTNGQSFEDYLYDIIDFRAGRTFAEHSKVTSCDGWSRLINDLCEYMKTALYNRKNIGQIKSSRGVGGLFDFLRQHDADVPKNINDHRCCNARDGDEDGCLGVLCIERA